MPTNRLASEKSLYLLQHAHNPVDWWPWGEDAFEAARVQNKPLFLSIGYSACHWCHVMERESFEHEGIAALLNQHFIAIKVDREERPDIDEIYMTAVQMMTGQGGWPMSVFLTPEGKPFYGGTYFPPENRFGRMGFGSLITQLSDAYANRRDEIEEVAQNIYTEITKTTTQKPLPATHDVPPTQLLAGALKEIAAHFDTQNGGFGGAPKFPPHHSLRLLCNTLEAGHTESLPLLTHTLDAMALGGIYDHVGGGFHRYATDAHWLLPHFEKMLYDNALLARVYAEAFRLTGKIAYARIARETCDWVLREMQSTEGGFYAAIDADSEGEEGKYYVWEYEEALKIAGKAYCDIYNIHPHGNFHDESTQKPSGKNIPHLSIGSTSPNPPHPTLLPDTLTPEILAAREAMLTTRLHRIAPNRDEKVITAWNGLMIGALARVGELLTEPIYLDAARRAADFCLTTLCPEGVLLRRYAGGEAGILAFLDDHLYLADGLLDLYEATHEAQYLHAARTRMDTVLAHFTDVENGGFYYTSDQHEALITRSKDIFDGALPSANGVGVRVLGRLGGEYRQMARALLTHFAGVIQRATYGMASFLIALPFVFPEGDEQHQSVAAHLHFTAPQASLPSAALFLSPETSHTLSFPLHLASGWQLNTPPVATIISNLPAQIGPVNVTPTSVEVPIQLQKNAPAGTYRLAVQIRVQLCGEFVCLPFQEHEAEMTLHVTT